MPDFGELLKSLRLNAGLTQKQLAKRLWVSKTTVSYYERSLRCPSPEILIKIANIFHVSADYLLGREQKEQTLDVSSLPDEDIEFLCGVVQFLKSKNRSNDKTPLT